MKKAIIISLVILIIILVVGGIFFKYFYRTIDFGKSCNDGGSQFANEGCVNRNINTTHINCTGNWKFIQGFERGSPNECQFICE